MKESGYLGRLHEQVCGNDRRLLPAPPKYLLKAFGGVMSVEEYRNCREEFKVVPSRLITVEGVNVHTSTTQRVRPTDGKVDFSGATARNDQLKLKLKRDKPLPSGQGRISMHAQIKR